MECRGTSAFTLRRGLRRANDFSTNSCAMVKRFLSRLAKGVRGTLCKNGNCFRCRTCCCICGGRVSKCLSSSLRSLILRGLPRRLFRRCRSTCRGPLANGSIGGLVTRALRSLSRDFFRDVRRRCVRSLLELTSVPFSSRIRGSLLRGSVTSEREGVTRRLTRRRQGGRRRRHVLRCVFKRRCDPSIRQTGECMLRVNRAGAKGARRTLRKVGSTRENVCLTPLELLTLRMCSGLGHRNVPYSLGANRRRGTITNSRRLSDAIRVFCRGSCCSIVIVSRTRVVASGSENFS